ncbi:MAG TPA: CbiX/SirB N-terminal domain-containing protein [Opitutaceae bacterium]|nr:CbiX/SirB N-terminal domain-containing protein [Opitutaceae bacterium]
MRVALIDNGSLEPAAHESLRTAADSVGKRAGTRVEAVSWRHSGRIPPGDLAGGPAWTLAPWVRARVSEGEREYVFVPFFICPQGAIGSRMRRDLEALGDELGGFDFSITEGLDAGTALAEIVADRVRETAAAKGLGRPAVVVVDHGGPSRASGAVRNSVADAARERLGRSIGPLAAASMEAPDGPESVFSRPLLPEALAAPGFDSGDVLIAPLFLSPGRHAGPGGDLERAARAAQARRPALRCHFTGLVGSHPAAIELLSGALLEALGAVTRP